MKYILLMILLIACKGISKKSEIQNIEPESQSLEDKLSLSQYSYLLYGFTKDGRRASGTGYFYNYKDRAYFITANHCITGWSAVDYKQEPIWPDSFNIRVKDRFGLIAECPINPKQVKASIEKYHFYERPDIFILQIDNAEMYSLNFINDFCKTNPIIDSGSTVVSFGFPTIYLEDQVLPSVRNIEPIKFIARLRGKYSDLNQTPLVNVFDSLHYQCNYIEGVFDKGRSGSPVFQTDSENKTVSFVGMLIAGSPSTKRTWVLKPDKVMKAIEEKIALNR